MSELTGDRQDFARAILAAGVASALLGALCEAPLPGTREESMAAWAWLCAVLAGVQFLLSSANYRRYSAVLWRLSLFACFALGTSQVLPLGMWTLFGS